MTVASTPDIPVISLAATTRARESRLVMALVDTLRARGAGPRDILVVVPDFEEYEDVLCRAAIRYGLTPTIWRHLPVVDTEPFSLLVAFCRVLDTDTVSIETLCRPLQHGWSPPDAEPDTWPLAAASLHRLQEVAPGGDYSVASWQDRSETLDADHNLDAYLDALAAQPATPTPKTAELILRDVLERYIGDGLPQAVADDDPARRRTERLARATVRLEELLDRLRTKYELWLDNGWVDRSWETVADLLERIASQHPGRREHANANAVDIIAANDVWGRQVPWVIAVGLSAGTWPQYPETPVPTPLQRAVLAGDDALAQLAVRPQWDALRQHDQFVEAVTAATDGVILTHHTQTTDGVDRPPSPLLDRVSSTTVAGDGVRDIVASDRRLPAALEAILPAASDDETGDRPDPTSETTEHPTHD